MKHHRITTGDGFRFALGAWSFTMLLALVTTAAWFGLFATAYNLGAR